MDVEASREVETVKLNSLVSDHILPQRFASPLKTILVLIGVYAGFLEDDETFHRHPSSSSSGFLPARP